MRQTHITNRLRMNFAFHATDEVSVYWRLHGLDKARWGNNAPGATAATTKYAYGEVKQDWGTISAGKLADTYGQIGLTSLGWNIEGIDDQVTDGGVYSFGDTERDGIRWANRYDSGFQMVVAGFRLDDVKAGTPIKVGDPAVTVDTVKNTQSTDLAVLQPSYHWDGGGAALTITYLKARTDGGLPASLHTGVDPYDEYSLSPSFSNSWGDFSLHAAAKMGFGNYQMYETGEKIKLEGQSVYVDGDYNYGPGNINLAAWWVSGGEKDDKMKSLFGMGESFYPLVVAYAGDYNAVAAANGNTGNGNVDWTANILAAMLSGSHSLSDDIALKYAVGYLTLQKAPGGDTNWYLYQQGIDAPANSTKKDIGTEVDLGLQIQLLDNLEFRTTAGYLMAGKALADADGKKEDAYSWYNTLLFRF